MTRKMAAVLFAWGAMGTALPLAGAEKPEEKGAKQSFEVTSAQRVNFQPGGTISLDNSYGYLTVEGWDEPEVEIIATKSTNRFYDPSEKEKAERGFEEVRVAVERRSDTELAISTTLPVLHGFPNSLLPSGHVIVTMPKTSKRGVTVEYTVHAPRDSRLVIHHDYGYVWVGDVKGDIEVDSHTGDMIVMLPDPGPYSIDATTRMGSISSDLMGRGNKEFLVGSRFVHGGQAPSRRILLRVGRGNITIKSGFPSGPFWKD